MNKIEKQNERDAALVRIEKKLDELLSEISVKPAKEVIKKNKEKK